MDSNGAEARNKPRKEASQPRSQATVGAILEAAARILAKAGQRLTTNHVARIAGVSVGSLYQYFPGKEAILTELVRRTMKARVARMRELLTSLEGEPIDVITRALVDLLISMRERPKFEQELVNAAFRFGDRAVWRAVDRETVTLLSEFLQRISQKTRPMETKAASFLLLHGVRAVLLTAAMDDPELLHSDAFRSELTTLISAYVGKGQSTSG
jgi:AcrR family transcriptional regulator